MSKSNLLLNPIRWLGSLAAVLLCSTGFASAADLRAQVARVADNGDIELLSNRLVDKFPDGTPVQATIDSSNGFLRLVRKGNKPNGDCLNEFTSLYDANHLAVSVGNTVAGQKLYLYDSAVVNHLPCINTGCHELGNLVVSARCDRTDQSGNLCKCHLNDGSGTTLAHGDFCRTKQDERTLVLVQWAWPQFIQ